MTPKGYWVIRGHLDLLYDPNGNGDLCGQFDPVYDPKRSWVTRGQLDLLYDSKVNFTFDLDLDLMVKHLTWPVTTNVQAL